MENMSALLKRAGTELFLLKLIWFLVYDSDQIKRCSVTVDPSSGSCACGQAIKKD